MIYTVKAFFPYEENRCIGINLKVIKNSHGRFSVNVKEGIHNKESSFEINSEEALTNLLSGYRGMEVKNVSADLEYSFLKPKGPKLFLINKVSINTVKRQPYCLLFENYVKGNLPDETPIYSVDSIREIPAVRELIEFFDKVCDGLGLNTKSA